jgi:hypothetical protein
MDGASKITGTEVTEPTYCVNATRGIEWWFCLHYGRKISPGTEAWLTKNGECAMCATASKWDGIGEAPSFIRPDGDL